MHTMLVINAATMGRGDDDLGARILQTLLGKSAALRGLETIVFYNSGVKLLAEGSVHLPTLAAIERNGVDLIACGTCVERFGLASSIRAGRVGSMDEILKAMNAADKVISI